ncbi:conserved repeat domain-containing protein [Rathayibacter oskolensis]|uniref:Conserved repeat domain-containing protein n=1 Tax=Rathayibacter oskolensis TaxID=1891671 RepID=A0A1X7PHR1_9MICO|nr:Ig-like domain-containing protein [Rathayibacter oskolensis]SMH50399.1 conserved repeat domain-containing protein [Rathayibacter oskolensis]
MTEVRAIRRHRRPGLRHRRDLALTVVLALLAVLLVVVPATKAEAATVLVQEAFGGTSVPDSAWQALDSACITRATAAPPTGSSTLGVCANRTDAPRASTSPGFLQLTDTRTNAKGGAIYNRPIPATGGLDVQFDQYQYQAVLGLQGADGIGFFLTDGSRSLTAAGAPGGSLGYGQSTTVDGVNGGYLGIGLDVYGNYSSSQGGLGAGCPTTPAPPGTVGNRIVARGPGQGRTGYCYLQGVAPGTSLRPTVNLGDTGAPAASAGRTVRVTISPATFPVVTVYYGASAGLAASALTQVMQFTMTTAAPLTYKLGFTASTGGSSDTHLIRNVSVSSINTLDDITLVKQIDRTTTQPATYSEGSVIPYQFVVTNGAINGTLTGVAVSDPKVPTVTCPTTTLAALATVTCTGSHTVTAAEAVAGSLVNTATATATKTVNTTTTAVTSRTATVTAAITTPAPAITLAKSGALTETIVNGQADAGERITYSFVARNTGNVTLQNVAVTDPKVTGITPTSTTLAPGASATFTSAAYTVTQADINSGTALTNTATVSGRTLAATPATVTATSTVNTPIRYAPAIALTKTGALTAGSTVGATIAYSFTVSNTGNVPLTAVAIADPKVTVVYGTWPGTAGQLGVAQSVGATATYTLTQADIDAGSVVNTATATGTPPTGSAVTSTASRTVTLTRAADLAFTKTANPAFISAAGSVVTYTFRATNTGNTTLTGVAITDPKQGLSSLTYTWPATAGRLAPAQVVTATATYTTTAADVTAGTIANTATVTATPPTGSAITRSASVTIAVVPDPQADSATVVQGGSVVIDVLANDGPAATGATFSRAQLSAAPKVVGGAAAPAPATPVVGSVTCVDSGATRGQCTYRPIASFVGTDVFDYALSSTYGTWNVRVTVTVTAVNRAPVARPDRVVATTGGAAVSVAPLANDTDPDAGATLTLASTGTVPRGTLTCAAGTCSYTPPAGFTGSVPIAYTVTDGSLTASSTITVSVDPAPLALRGFTDTDSTAGSIGLGTWTRSSVVATPVSSCVSGRPSTVVSWAAAPGTTGYTLERRLAGATPGAWSVVATPSGTTFTDDRVGEGRSYQWRVRPDLHRWLGVASPASTAVTQPAVATARGC